VNVIKNSDYFTVKDVVCKGVINGNKKKIDKELVKFIGKNIFDINEKRKILIDDIWIIKAVLSKKYPDTIVVKIYEKKPLFAYKKKNKCYQYVSSGDSIRISCRKHKDINIFVLTSNDVLKNFSEIVSGKNFKGSKIRLHRSYFEILKDNFRLYCSYDKNVFDKNFEIFNKGIKQRYKKIKYVDLRVDGKIYVDGVSNEAG
jgi:cell division protein FtsQ